MPTLAPSLLRCARSRPILNSVHRPAPIGRRLIQISPAPSSSSPTFDHGVPNGSGAPLSPAPDARFEVIGSPFSLLSVSLAASQNLYTRRGTVVGISGKVENTVSTLSLLEPFRRAVLGIPFLYQRISSTSPLAALVSTKSSISSFAVVHLDGRQDWIIAQRQALLSWTGHALSVRPKINTKLSLAHWGSSHITGRGLLALVGKGQIYQIKLKAGETYVVHPGNVVAYVMTQNPPLPYRFKSTALRLQIPSTSLGALIPNTKFFRVMSETNIWRTTSRVLFWFRTWARKSIWGDRLFLQFHGPSTILLQSRGSRISDILTTQDVNEIADSPPGAVQSALSMGHREQISHEISASLGPPGEPEPRVRYANIGQSGKVEIKDS
ncbi:uncharacterized protein K441DRAFT_611430 [Cenococcum geophilum 1.58]|uniref:uncharacterized protein n=1 Tax=Cenococcum geophilum 1.58 TaxID=794803 RepID=UPI00358EFBF4|nr:hypothetical protein K441DRAFT_611430 [Cenococcum geophilum 1.58]